ncbi:hypothetical protein AB0J52_16680 [Spirillospora sp. NPDC049652]
MNKTLMTAVAAVTNRGRRPRSAESMCGLVRPASRHGSRGGSIVAKRVGAVVASVAVAGTGMVAVSGPASAGGCLEAICGKVLNESSHTVWAIRDYDDNGPKPGTEWRALYPGESTPSGQDWDGFYVRCKASGRIARWVFPGFWAWRDFNMSAGYAMKIATNDEAHVRSQSC